MNQLNQSMITTPLAVGQTGQSLIMNAYTLHYIPKRMYIFVRPDLSSYDNNTTIN